MPNSFVGETRELLGPLGFRLSPRAKAICKDISQHTDRDVPRLGRIWRYQFGAALLGVGIFILAFLIGRMTDSLVLCLIVLLIGAIVALYVGLSPWLHAAKALLDHFFEETQSYVADPDYGLDDVGVTVLPVGQWEIWKARTIERKEFSKGSPLFWSMFRGSARAKLNDLQDVLNRHWAFHMRYPQLAGGQLSEPETDSQQ